MWWSRQFLQSPPEPDHLCQNYWEEDGLQRHPHLCEPSVLMYCHQMKVNQLADIMVDIVRNVVTVQVDSGYLKVEKVEVVVEGGQFKKRENVTLVVITIYLVTFLDGAVEIPCLKTMS